MDREVRPLVKMVAKLTWTRSDQRPAISEVANQEDDFRPGSYTKEEEGCCMV